MYNDKDTNNPNDVTSSLLDNSEGMPEEEIEKFQNSVADIRLQVLAALPKAFFTARIESFKDKELFRTIDIENPKLKNSCKEVKEIFRSLSAINTTIANYLKENDEEFANIEKILLLLPNTEENEEEIKEFQAMVDSGKETIRITITELTDPVVLINSIKWELYENIKLAYENEQLLTLVTLFSNLSLFLEEGDEIRNKLVELINNTDGTMLASREALEQFGFIETEKDISDTENE